MRLWNFVVDLYRGILRMGAGSINTPKAIENGEYQFGGREIRIDRAISHGEYLSGKCFGRGSTPSSATTGINPTKPLATMKLSIPYKTPLKPVDKRTIDLHPVNLASARHPTPASSSKTNIPATYWTANW